MQGRYPLPISRSLARIPLWCDIRLCLSRQCGLPCHPPRCAVLPSRPRVPRQVFCRVFCGGVSSLRVFPRAFRTGIGYTQSTRASSLLGLPSLPRWRTFRRHPRTWVIRILLVRCSSFSREGFRTPSTSLASSRSCGEALRFRTQELTMRATSRTISFPDCAPPTRPLPFPLATSPSGLCPCRSPSPSNLVFSTNTLPSSLQSRPTHPCAGIPIPGAPSHALSSSLVQIFSLRSLSSS